MSSSSEKSRLGHFPFLVLVLYAPLLVESSLIDCSIAEKNSCYYVSHLFYNLLISTHGSSEKEFDLSIPPPPSLQLIWESLSISMSKHSGYELWWSFWYICSEPEPNKLPSMKLHPYMLVFINYFLLFNNNKLKNHGYCQVIQICNTFVRDYIKID
jgi:hypothetical protein